jgi:nucleotide-binding universal stress UspA family protein
MYRRVLLCYDGSAEGRRALREGARVALAVGAQAHLLAICKSMISGSTPEGLTPALINCQDDVARALLDEGVEKLRELGVQAEGTLMYGNPIVEIPRVARKIAADLIVVGHRSRGRLARWWTESDEQTLLDHINCSILVSLNAAE